MKRVLALPAALLAALFVGGCSTTDVEMPTGTSKGYMSARFVAPKTGTPPDFVENSAEVNGMIRDAIADQFRNRGLTVGNSDADLVIAYLLITQDNSSTTAVDEYFGYSRSSLEIQDVAHQRGVIDNNRPDAFQAGAVVIDLIDARTNELVYRNFARRDMIPGLAPAARRQRIDEAVAEALAPFFR